MGKFSHRREVSIFGLKVAEVEVTSEFIQSFSSKERSAGRSYGMLPLNQDFIAPILSKAVQKITSLAPEKFRFENGSELTVDGNIDAYSGVQGLKKISDFNGVVQIVFGVAALTNAYDKSDLGVPAVFLGHVLDIIRVNWETQETTTEAV